MSRPDYVYPKLSRAGLGNLLFPWAKAVALAERSGAEMLAPKWFKLRGGPHLRRDFDRRQYHKLFRRPPVGALWLRQRILRTGTLWSESGLLLRRGSAVDVVVIESMDDHFQPLVGTHELVYRRLLAEARQDVLASVERSSPYISMHVRLGDFLRSEGTGEHATVNVSTPIAWFVDAVHCLREGGWGGPIVVCSDGRADELSALTRLPDVERSSGDNALHDLLTLANGELIIGSGSAFSAWAAFLRERPVYVKAGYNHFLERLPQAREVAAWTDRETVDAARADIARLNAHAGPVGSGDVPRASDATRSR